MKRLLPLVALMALAVPAAAFAWGGTYPTGDTYASSIQIQVSDNASTWTSIYSTTTGTGGTQTLNITGSGRYVRMNGTARATQYGYSLWEMAVYAS